MGSISRHVHLPGQELGHLGEALLRTKFLSCLPVAHKVPGRFSELGPLLCRATMSFSFKASALGLHSFQSLVHVEVLIKQRLAVDLEPVKDRKVVVDLILVLQEVPACLLEESVPQNDLAILPIVPEELKLALIVPRNTIPAQHLVVRIPVVLEPLLFIRLLIGFQNGEVLLLGLDLPQMECLLLLNVRLRHVLVALIRAEVVHEHSAFESRGVLGKLSVVQFRVESPVREVLNLLERLAALEPRMLP